LVRINQDGERHFETKPAQTSKTPWPFTMSKKSLALSVWVFCLVGKNKK